MDIRNTMTLQDKMSASLRVISKELSVLDNLMGQVDSSSNTMLSGVSKDSVKVVSELNKMEKGLNEVNNASEKINTSQGMKNVEKDAKNATREINNGSNALNNMHNQMSVFKGTFLGSVASNLFTNLLQGVKTTITDAVDLASGLVEVQNVVDVTYGNSAKRINEWSKSTLKDFGLSELAAKQYASTFAAMMKASDVNQKAMTDMSIGLAQLTGDVASFRNLRPEDVFYKLKSVITGETETMKDLGVVMTEVNLQNYMLKNGIKGSYRNMDQASKIVLRYNFAMEALKDTQGDFTRTLPSFANQSKLLTENWNQFTATIATYVLPFLALLLQGLNNVIYFLTDHADSVAIVLGTLAVMLALVAAKALFAGQASLLAGIQAAIGWLGALWPVLLIIAGIGLLLVILNEFGIGASQVLGFVGGLFGAFFAFIYNKVAVLYNIFAALGNFIHNVFKNPIASVQILFYDLAIAVIGYLRKMGKAIEDLLNSIPFVEVNITSSIDKVYAGLEKNRDKLKKDSGWEEVFKEMEYMDVGETFNSWQKGTNDFVSGLGDAISGLGDMGNLGNLGDLYKGTGVGMNDLNINKVKEVGKIKDDVSITDEDIELMKDVAKVEYVNQFTTLNPNLNVQFGDIRETADVNEVMVAVKDMVSEAIATALV